MIRFLGRHLFNSIFFSLSLYFLSLLAIYSLPVSLFYIAQRSLFLYIV